MSFRSTAAILTTSALAFAGCAGSESGETEATLPPPTISETDYTEDGRRITYIPIDIVNYRVYTAVVEYCSGGPGGDLITLSERDSPHAGIGIDRAVGHAACLDGILTPEDFPQVDG